jgi:transcriptional regulator with XRE-family HTH domain
MYALPNFNAAFAKILRARREQARLSQMKIAAAVGGSEVYVRRMERGKQTPTVTTLVLLARALGVEPETLLAEILHQMACLDALPHDGQ